MNNQLIETIIIGRGEGKGGWPTGLQVTELATGTVRETGLESQGIKTEDIYKLILMYNQQGYVVTAIAGNAINSSSTIVMTRISEREDT